MHSVYDTKFHYPLSINAYYDNLLATTGYHIAGFYSRIKDTKFLQHL